MGTLNMVYYIRDVGIPQGQWGLWHAHNCIQSDTVSKDLVASRNHDAAMTFPRSGGSVEVGPIKSGTCSSVGYRKNRGEYWLYRWNPTKPREYEGLSKWYFNNVQQSPQ